MTVDSLSAQSAAWVAGLRFEDLPADVVQATKLRVLDSLGLMLIAGTTNFGAALRDGVSAMGQGDQCTMIGLGTRNSAMLAALANGALAEALQFDDTHNETIIHATSPTVAAALAAAESGGAGGRDFLAAVAAGNELSCRIGVIAPGTFHPRGLHPTGIIGTFGATFAAARLFGLTEQQTVAAAGHAGSFASGILACWEDGTDTQFIHPGWSAHSAIAATLLSRSGLTGPAAVLEGRFGLLPSHLHDLRGQLDFDRMTRDLGAEWESRNMSFKPYPTAHIIHPFLDALLYLYREEGLRASDVETLTVRIAEYMIPVVCEPVAEKTAPRTEAHGRVSLQYSLAEALYHGRLGGDGYSAESIRDPAILELSGRIRYEIDPDAPGTERYKGWVVAETTDGRRLERIEDYNRGSPEKPMTAEDVGAKFMANAENAVSRARAEAIMDAVDRLQDADGIDALVALCR